MVNVSWIQRTLGAESCYNMGQRYETGAIVSRDMATALEWYRASAALGHVDAQLWLADHYRKQKNVAEARQYYRKAIVKKPKLAHYGLALLLEDEEKYSAALEAFELAASLGCHLSEKKLIDFSRTGDHKHY